MYSCLWTVYDTTLIYKCLDGGGNLICQESLYSTQKGDNQRKHGLCPGSGVLRERFTNRNNLSQVEMTPRLYTVQRKGT